MLKGLIYPLEIFTSNKLLSTTYFLMNNNNKDNDNNSNNSAKYKALSEYDKNKCRRR